jgi:hypothetical protein
MGITRSLAPEPSLDVANNRPARILAVRREGLAIAVLNPQFHGRQANPTVRIVQGKLAQLHLCGNQSRKSRLTASWRREGAPPCFSARVRRRADLKLPLLRLRRKGKRPSEVETQHLKRRPHVAALHVAPF